MQTTLPIAKSTSLSSAQLEWHLYSFSSDTLFDPSQSHLLSTEKYPAVVPGTVASTFTQDGKPDWQPRQDYDNKDWLFETQFTASPLPSEKKQHLIFKGLATLCDVWLNGEKILSSDNMFRGYRLDVSNKIKTNNRLQLHFRSISHFLSQSRRERPRWKTKLTSDQQMRWIRTSVLGYVDSWTPEIKCIGPWQSIELEQESIISKKSLQIASRLEGAEGVISIKARFQNLSDSKQNISAKLHLGEHSFLVNFESQGDDLILDEEYRQQDILAWWPHTHGKANLYQCDLEISTNNQKVIYNLGQIGFKSAAFCENKSQLRINEEAIFCRGVCWSGSDFISHNASPEILAKQLELLKQTGVNMIRVGGTMVYESNDFYQLCDQLGILVWQDFMFASMDYPFEDAAFSANATAEANYQLARLSKYTCISVYCGNTDIKAQAAMFGFPPKDWSNSFFDNTLAQLCAQFANKTPYFSSSPEGGTLPFHLNEGITHYWGVGAYMRPADDRNIERVKFASEGMGHSHIPFNQSISDSIGKNRQPQYDSQWLSRIPKDLGAGWNFEPIRDYYLEQIFKVDAAVLRRTDPARFLALSQIVTGEVVANVFRQWRKQGSQCQGGLLWFARDFWPSAGFGIIDSYNRPKPVCYQLKQIWRSRQAIVTNDGLDGAKVTLINEHAESLSGKLEITLLKDLAITVAKGEQTFCLERMSKSFFSVDEIVGGFFDTGYDYQFGNRSFDIICCRMFDQFEQLIDESYLIFNQPDVPLANVNSVSITACQENEDTIKVVLQTQEFLQFVSIEAKGYQADEQFYHLAPGYQKTITLNKVATPARKFRGQLNSLNLSQPKKMTLND